MGSWNTNAQSEFRHTARMLDLLLESERPRLVMDVIESMYPSDGPRALRMLGQLGRGGAATERATPLGPRRKPDDVAPGAEREQEAAALERRPRGQRGGRRPTVVGQARQIGEGRQPPLDAGESQQGPGEKEADATEESVVKGDVVTKMEVETVKMETTEYGATKEAQGKKKTVRADTSETAGARHKRSPAFWRGVRRAIYRIIELAGRRGAGLTYV